VQAVSLQWDHCGVRVLTDAEFHGVGSRSTALYRYPNSSTARAEETIPETCEDRLQAAPGCSFCWKRNASAMSELLTLRERMDSVVLESQHM
jgi:hypothetical protein